MIVELVATGLADDRMARSWTVLPVFSHGHTSDAESVIEIVANETTQHPSALFPFAAIRPDRTFVVVIPIIFSLC